MKKSVFLLSLISFCLLSFHPIYVSTAEIDYKDSENKIEIAIKIFSDDLEKVISKNLEKNIEIGTDREASNATDLIVEYLRSNFSVTVNGKVMPFNYVNRRMVKEDFFAMWVLLEIPKVRKAKTIDVRNTILFDLNRGQQNIINYRDVSSTYQKFVTYEGYGNATLKE